MKKSVSTPSAALNLIGGGTRTGETHTEANRRGGKRLLVAGAAVLALAGTAKAGDMVLDQHFSSDIPSHMKTYDPEKYHQVEIPQNEMPFNFAGEVDSDHNPQNGVYNMSEQLGHPVQPGDTVWVPGSTDPK